MWKLKEYLNRFLLNFCGFLFFFITILGTCQVISDHIFDYSNTILDELIIGSFIWISMLVTSYGLGNKKGIKIHIFLKKLPRKLQDLLSLFEEIIILSFSAEVLILDGILIIPQLFSIGVLTRYISFIMPLSGVIISIYSILNIGKIFEKIF